ncbi:MAG: DUF1844 domain-containing protein [Bacteroidota bacterium]
MLDPSTLNGDNLNEEQQQQLLFMMLIQQHQQIAMMGMGKIKNPATDKIERDMNSAKYAIDTLEMLQTYTEGNLPKEMKNFLAETLKNLRLNYASESEKEDEGDSDGAENTAGEEQTSSQSDDS